MTTHVNMTWKNKEYANNIQNIITFARRQRILSMIKFTLEAVGLQYFDEVEDKFVMIEASKLEIGEDIVIARFADYQLGFQRVLFEGETKPTMTMSKYDFKNKKFVEHYTCDAEMGYIEQEIYD